MIGGPNGGTNGDEPSFDFVMGTGVTSTSGSVRTAFGVWLDFAPDDVPPDGATLRLYGPPGWSFGPRTFQMTAAMIASGFTSGTSDLAPMSGNYSIELDLKDGTVLTAGPRSLASVDTVDLPSGLAFSETSATTVTLEWDPHPTALSFWVRLYRVEDGPTEVASMFTHDAEATFSGLALAPGAYFVTVNAQPIDRLADPIPMVDRYDVAQTRSDDFVVGP